ncbi:MAG: FAD-dependent oxidoreductase [Verrucomicrobia bacterium]|nr:FAD-dependent oxidoreductase [Verrucomicrobiota bacterium]
MKPRFFLALAFAFAANSPFSMAAEPARVDIVIYGGTSGGIAAAIAAAREGKSALLLEPSRHLGGLTTGGLGATDIGNKAAIGGIAREFYERIHQHYAKPEAWKWDKPQDTTKSAAGQERGKDPLAEKTGRPTKWTFEPHVAMTVFKQMLREAKVEPLFGQRLVSVRKNGARIVEIAMENGRVFAGKMFIDATYEGDLMAKAGVSHTVGREANAQYGETLNGVRAQTPHHQFKVPVDPYVKPGDLSSGLLPFIQPGDGGKPGDGDKAVQAYNYRLCMTKVPGNKTAWTAPRGYDEKKYELLARLIEAHVAAGKPLTVGQLMNPGRMPNGKTDTNNNGAFSTDFIGMNYDYPDGDFATRDRIAREHEHYIRGFLYFLATSKRVPQTLRDEMNSWGLARDEFAGTRNFPPQMYVREARRMISDYVMTEHECRWERKPGDGVGLGAYGMDSHNCQRLVKNGRVENEGDVEVGVRGPYPISYRSIVPKASECENFFVPICLSATHIAYGSIRMEPVFMILGQSSAVAAALAVDGGTPVQKVIYEQLAARLKQEGQIITNEGFPARQPHTANALDPAKLGGIIVDDAQAQVTGEWSHGATAGPFVGDGYLHDGNEDKGQKRVRFVPNLPSAGRYEVRIIYSALSNRASNVPVVVRSADGEKTVTVNQKVPLPGDEPLSLGTFRFDAGANGWLEIRTDGTDGHVIADAVQFVPVR